MSAPNSRVAAASNGGQYSNPSSPSYQRSACFTDLIHTVRSHSTTLPPSDLINFISTELPIDTSAALQGADTICALILNAPFLVCNLETRPFLSKNGNQIQLNTDFASKRPADLFYCSFDCTVNGAAIDNRITQPSLHFTFSLRLPQTT
jgi:hypothetical protein